MRNNTCQTCGLVKLDRDNRIRKFCSRKCRFESQKGKATWNKGKTGIYTPESLVKMSLAKIGKPPPNKGVPRPYMRGDKHPHWKGGISPQRILDMSRTEYTSWKVSVFEKDNYTCVKCGETNKKLLQADHIKMYATHPELRYDVQNGQTLCKSCHRLKTNADLSLHFRMMRALNELIAEGKIEKTEIEKDGIKYLAYKVL